ncbi:MAG: ankyrin repeat domain-containing protein, partial [Chthoniobacteraceae bacterium]
LPRDLRNKLNRSLDDGQPGNEILQWLNRDKTVRKILAGQFDSTPITKQNLSSWKTGDGFLNWKNNRDALDLAKELGGDADETFTEFGNDDEGSPAFADKMALWFSVRYMVMARSLIASVQNADLEKQESAMRRILRDLSALRRSEHSAGRLRLEHKRLEFQKTQGADAKEKAFWKRARSSEVEEEINKSRPKSDDEKRADERMRDVSVMLFGSCSSFLTEEERAKLEEYENSQNQESEDEEPTPDSDPDLSPEQSSPVQAPQSKNAESGHGEDNTQTQPGTLNPEPGTASENWTPLHEAVEIGRKDIVESIIAQGAEVSPKDVYLRTPLHIAAIQGHKEIAEILIASNAEINPSSIYDCTPLTEARNALHHDLAELLTRHGGHD